MFPLLAFIAGAAIAVQAAMNARLGELLKSSMMGTSVAFLMSFIFTFVLLVCTSKSYPTGMELKAVPSYLWLSGAALSAFGVSIFYYLIPKMGVGTMMSYALSGQIIFAMCVSHWGWFGLPVKAISVTRLAGLVLFIVGIVMINTDLQK